MISSAYFHFLHSELQSELHIFCGSGVLSFFTYLSQTTSCVILRIFWYACWPIWRREKTYFENCFLLWVQQSQIRSRRYENKEKSLFYFVLEFFCQSKFSYYLILKIQKIQKSTPSSMNAGTAKSKPTLFSINSF
jgi:hypothetical protein